MIAGQLPPTEHQAGGPPVIVVNQTLARELWPGMPPSAVIGRLMATGRERAGPWREVIGVVRDVRACRPDAPSDAEVYVPYAQAPVPSLAFTVRTTGSPESLVPTIRAELAQLDPTLPMAAVRSFDEVIAAATRSSRLYSVLTAIFGILAASLAIIGIYSVMSYTVAQRTRELAIRAALGAAHGGLLRLVLREGFIMSAIGIAAGLGWGVRRFSTDSGAALSGESNRSACVCADGGRRCWGGRVGISDPGLPRIARRAGGCASQRVVRSRGWGLGIRGRQRLTGFRPVLARHLLGRHKHGRPRGRLS